MLDNDNTHAFYVFPAGSTITPGGYLVVDISPFFGLGAADSVRIFDPTVTSPVGATPYESYSWTAHATTTYGRCPNGTGPFVTTTSSTKNAANDCTSPVKINEVSPTWECPVIGSSSQSSASDANISGFILRTTTTHSYLIPAGTTVSAGGYLRRGRVRLCFWAALIALACSTPGAGRFSVGRAADVRPLSNGTGGFITTTSLTKGAANNCASGSR
jgi:hypothetical protein